jgi:hypothetical protein
MLGFFMFGIPSLTQFLVIAAYTTITAVTILSAGSLFNSSVSWRGAGGLVYTTVAAPVVAHTRAIRGNAATFAAIEAEAWVEMFAASPAGYNTSNIEGTPRLGPGLTPAQARRCKENKDSLPPNTTARCDSNTTEPLDDYYAARHSWTWTVIRFSYTFFFMYLLWQLRAVLTSIVYWVVVVQIWGTACFIVHDVLTRGGFWRSGQAHPYSGAPTATATVIYFLAGSIYVIVSCLFAVRLFACDDVRALMQRHVREPTLEAPAADNKGWRRVGAGDLRSPFDRMLEHARLHGYTLQQTALACEADKAAGHNAPTGRAMPAVPESLSSLAAIRDTVDDLMEDLAHAADKLSGAQIAVSIGPINAPESDLVKVRVSRANTRALHPFVNVVNTRDRSKKLHRLLFTEMANLQVVYGRPPVKFVVAGFAGFSDADLAAVSDAPTRQVLAVTTERSDVTEARISALVHSSMRDIIRSELSVLCAGNSSSAALGTVTGVVTEPTPESVAASPSRAASPSAANAKTPVTPASKPAHKPPGKGG